MRIIAGVLGGRCLQAPQGLATRPTADRVKEAIFDILGPPCGDGAEERLFRVMDLYAGSGALGLEAISRGADEAVLVEADPRAAAVARRNIAALGLVARVRLLQRALPAALGAISGVYDWVFIDPPYGTGLLERTLDELGAGRLLAQAAVVVAEHDRRNEPAARYHGLVLSDRRRYGHTGVSFYRADDANSPQGGHA